MDHIDLFTVVFTTLAWDCYKHLYFERKLKYSVLVLCRYIVGTTNTTTYAYNCS